VSAFGGATYDNHERVTGLFGTVQDITDRKQAEEALRESDVFIKTVMDNLPIGVAVNSIDPTVEFEYMNDNFPKFYRTTREALSKPDAFWPTVYEEPEFREELKKRVSDDIASGDPARMPWVDITDRKQRRRHCGNVTSNSRNFLPGCPE
jgi:PAS domain-containing protein